MSLLDMQNQGSKRPLLIRLKHNTIQVDTVWEKRCWIDRNHPKYSFVW